MKILADALRALDVSRNVGEIVRKQRLKCDS